MTTDLEKQFFDAFGIEPKQEDACELADEYWNNEHLANEYGFFDNYMLRKGCTEHIEGCTDNCRHAYTKEIYSQITDTHYLKMVVFLSGEDWYELGKDLEYAKKRILDIFISNSHQEEKIEFIRTLFKE